VAGKLFGAGPDRSAGYAPVFSVQRVLDFQRMMVSDVFLERHYPVWPVWAGLTIVACVSLVCRKYRNGGRRSAIAGSFRSDCAAAH